MINLLPRWQKRLLVVLAGVAVLGLLGFSFVVGRVLAGPDYPSSTSADAGFARDMQIHHAQAVEMSLMVRDRTENEEVRAIAYDIVLTQQQQIGQMYGWLREWNLPQSSGGQHMAWMSAHPTGHNGHDKDYGAGTRTAKDLEVMSEGLMPGMATSAQLAALSNAEGVDADRLHLTPMIAHHLAALSNGEGFDADRVYLTLMIAHHVAGADMAEAAADLAETGHVRMLAAKMAEGQQAEITALQELLGRI